MFVECAMLIMKIGLCSGKIIQIVYGRSKEVWVHDEEIEPYED